MKRTSNPSLLPHFPFTMTKRQIHKEFDQLMKLYYNLEDYTRNVLGQAVSDESLLRWIIERNNLCSCYSTEKMIEAAQWWIVGVYATFNDLYNALENN